MGNQPFNEQTIFCGFESLKLSMYARVNKRKNTDFLHNVMVNFSEISCAEVTFKENALNKFLS